MGHYVHVNVELLITCLCVLAFWSLCFCLVDCDFRRCVDIFKRMMFEIELGTSPSD